MKQSIAPILLLFLFCSALSIKQTLELEEIEPSRPIADKRRFFTARLENNLTVLHIWDPKANMASGSLSVSVGAMQDPFYAPGLAHFLEHMLFMGSHKYPSISHFHELIASFQGDTNAFTSPDETNYVFRCSQEGFKEVIDHWCEFFVSPLLSQEAVYKEVNAVNSEFENKQSLQARAEMYSMRALVDKSHPLTKFQTGSIETLRNRPYQSDINIIKELRLFYDKYYSANLMKLVITSSKDPRELFPHIRHHFARIPDKQVDVLSFYDPKKAVFRDKSFMVKYKARNNGLKKLKVLWELPYDPQQTQKQSIAYICELFNNQGPNSLQRHLKDEFYINSFKASEEQKFRTNQIIELSMDLTKQGYLHMEQVLGLVFGYLEQQKSQEPDQGLYEYLKKNERVSFMTSAQQEDVQSISSAMQHQPLLKIFSAKYDYSQLDKAEVQSLLALMNQQRAQYTLGNDEFQYQAGKLKKHYRALKHKYLYQIHRHHYLQYQILENPLQINSSNLTFSPSFVDKYIPQNIVMGERSSPQLGAPALLAQNVSCRWYHLKETAFQTPIQYVGINILSNSTHSTVQQQTLNELLRLMLLNMVNEQFYYIQDSSLMSIRIDSQKDGLYFEFKGHPDSLTGIIKEFMSKVPSYLVDHRRFQQLKNSQIKIQKNKQMLPGSTQVFLKTRLLMSNQEYSVQEKIQAYLDLTLEDLIDLRSQWLRNAFTTGYCTGFIEESQCKAILRTVLKLIEQDEENRDLKAYLPTNKRLVGNSSIVLRNGNKIDKNHAISYQIQVGVQNFFKEQVLGLFQAKLRNMAFEYLRTQKQLGYQVDASQQINEGVITFQVIIQGVAESVEVYRKEVEYLLSTIYPAYFSSLSPESFSSLKEATLQQILKQQFTQQSLFNRNMDKINQQNFNFQSRDQRILMLQSLQLDQVQDFFSKLWGKARLVVMLKNQAEFTEEDRKNQLKCLAGLQRMDFYRSWRAK